jgi:hypothetical protein
MQVHCQRGARIQHLLLQHAPRGRQQQQQRARIIRSQQQAPVRRPATGGRSAGQQPWMELKVLAWYG